MYKQNIKCYGEVLDNYLEINTPLNMEIQDFLKDYAPTKFKKYSSTFDRRKNMIEKCDYDITLNFAKFLVTSLNNALRGRVNYNNPAMKNAYFTKKLQQKEFGITYYNIQNVMCFTITEIPVSKIGKILSKKRIFKNKNKHSDEKYADLSIDWLSFNLDQKDELSKSEREDVKSLSIKTYGLKNGFIANTIDAQMAFKDLPDEESSFSLFSGVINHMIYTQMLRDINERFNKITNKNTLLMEEKILKGMFVKNTMILDGFRDLAQKGFEMHPAMWRAAFESLTYGDVPFFQNFKLSHVAGIDKFYGQVYRNLKIMEDEFADYSDEYKEKALQQWRGVFSNLVSDRVLFADIAAIEEISNVFSLLKTKARIFSNYEEDVLSSSLNTMYSVIKTDAKRFLLTYGFNVNKIDSYMPSVNEDISNVLLHELIPLEQKNIIMKKSAQIDIKEIYNELGFENEPVYRLFYAQAFKTTMSVFYPEIEFAVKDFVLDKKLLNEIEEFKHAGMDRLENLMKLASNNSDLNVIFIANEDVMNETYPIHVLSVIGTLVNASIINNLNKKCIPEIKPFDSIDNRLITRSNGDIFNDALFAMRETIEFFENKDYIKHKEIINKIKLSVREHNLKYQLSLDGNEKKDVKIRKKV